MRPTSPSSPCDLSFATPQPLPHLAPAHPASLPPSTLPRAPTPRRPAKWSALVLVKPSRTARPAFFSPDRAADPAPSSRSAAPIFRRQRRESAPVDAGRDGQERKTRAACPLCGGTKMTMCLDCAGCGRHPLHCLDGSVSGGHECGLCLGDTVAPCPVCSGVEYKAARQRANVRAAEELRKAPVRLPTVAAAAADGVKVPAEVLGL